MTIFKARDTERPERTIDDFADYEERFGRVAAQPAPAYELVPKVIERFEFKPKKRFDPQFFTKRERRIMETLAEMFRDAKGDDMTEVSHLRELPWRQVFGSGEGNGQPIPYDLALSCAPIIKDMPTIDADELAYRNEALREVRKHTGR